MTTPYYHRTLKNQITTKIRSCVLLTKKISSKKEKTYKQISPSTKQLYFLPLFHDYDVTIPNFMKGVNTERNSFS